MTLVNLKICVKNFLNHQKNIKEVSELEEKEKEKKCTICNDKEVLLHTEIGVFRGILCPRCYMVKMLKEICKKLGIKDNSSWLKRE